MDTEGDEGSSNTGTVDHLLPVSVEQIVGEALHTYEVRTPEELMTLLRRRYDPRAEFVDPTIVARPRRALALARYALQKLYREVEVRDIIMGAPQMALVEQAHGPALLQVAVHSEHRYVFTRANHISQQVLPEDARRNVATTLLVDPRTGLVLRHEDSWVHHPPVRLPLAWRRLNCACSNAVYRLLGWERELRAADAHKPSWEA